MKKLFISSGVMFSLLMLGGCVTAKPGSPEAQALALQKIEEQKVEQNEQTVSDIPKWCLNVPSSDLAIYACGTGTSSDMNIARMRATLTAKQAIADSVQSKISADVDLYLKTAGTDQNEEVLKQSEIVIKNVTLEAELIGYKQTKAETQSVGTKFKHYVLLEYPIGPANKALLEAVKKDEIMRTGESAAEALAELEAQIAEKKAE